MLPHPRLCTAYPAAVLVATYNVRHCRGLDGVVDAGRVAETIAASGAELVALQEVDRNQPRSGRVDQAAELARLTGLEVWFGATLGFKGGEFGLALASTEPLQACLIELPRLGAKEPRKAIRARWRGFEVLAVHLSNQRPAGRAQLAALSRLAAGLQGPALVLGDFNAGRWRVARALDGFVVSPRRNTLGWRAIDFVAVRGARIVRAYTISSRASDHLPLVAELAP